LKASTDNPHFSIFEESNNNEIPETGTPNYLPESLVMDFFEESKNNKTDTPTLQNLWSWILRRGVLTTWLIYFQSWAIQSAFHEGLPERHTFV